MDRWKSWSITLHGWSLSIPHRSSQQRYMLRDLRYAAPHCVGKAPVAKKMHPQIAWSKVGASAMISSFWSCFTAAKNVSREQTETRFQTQSAFPFHITAPRWSTRGDALSHFVDAESNGDSGVFETVEEGVQGMCFQSDTGVGAVKETKITIGVVSGEEHNRGYEG